MQFDLYVWASPRDLDPEEARELIEAWEAEGGDPRKSPFEPSGDIGWFHRELTKDLPWLPVTSDAIPNPSTLPIVLSPDQEPPARVIAIRLPRNDANALEDALEDIYSLAVKYDSVVFDSNRGVITLPQEQMAELARAEFWPWGAVRTVIAIVLGLGVAVGAWMLGIPLLSGGIALFALFMVAIFIASFYVAIRDTLKRRAEEANPEA